MHAAVAIGSTTSKVVEMILDFGERPISQWHVLFWEEITSLNLELTWYATTWLAATYLLHFDNSLPYLRKLVFSCPYSQVNKNVSKHVDRVDPMRPRQYIKLKLSNTTPIAKPQHGLECLFLVLRTDFISSLFSRPSSIGGRRSPGYPNNTGVKLSTVAIRLVFRVNVGYYSSWISAAPSNLC